MLHYYNLNYSTKYVCIVCVFCVLVYQIVTLATILGLDLFGSLLFLTWKIEILQILLWNWIWSTEMITTENNVKRNY